MTKTLNGACLCEKVKISFETSKDYFDACHCSMCRKWSGGPALTVEAGQNVKIQGEENVTVFKSSQWAERAFCNGCGTHLFYRLQESKFTNVPLGILDQAKDLNFHLQIYIDSKPHNYEFANKTEVMTEAQVIAKFSGQ